MGDERLFLVNHGTPKPCPIPYERIRKEALQIWGEETAILYKELLHWLERGAPDSTPQGALLSPSTHQPPLPGQPQFSPVELLDKLIEASIFLKQELKAE